MVLKPPKKFEPWKKKKNLKHTPIVALTANADATYRQKFFDAGMDEYLAKPLEMNLLHKVLKKYLKPI
jgi:CheY-like chemotaxis protein